MKTDGQSSGPIKGDAARVCRYSREARVLIQKRCLLQGECFHCAFDQWIEAFDETIEQRPVGKAA